MDDFTGVHPDEWDGVEERRKQVRVCTGNCLDHSGTKAEIKALESKIVVVLEDHETVVKFSDRVNFLLLIFSAIGLSLIGGAIYVFVTNSNFAVNYAKDMVKISDTIHDNQKNTVEILNSNQKDMEKMVSEIKESFSKRTTEVENRIIALETKRENAEKRADKFDHRINIIERIVPNKVETTPSKENKQ